MGLFFFFREIHSSYYERVGEIQYQVMFGKRAET